MKKMSLLIVFCMFAVAACSFGCANSATDDSESLPEMTASVITPDEPDISVMESEAWSETIVINYNGVESIQRNITALGAADALFNTYSAAYICDGKIVGNYMDGPEHRVFCYGYESDELQLFEMDSSFLVLDNGKVAIRAANINKPKSWYELYAPNMQLSDVQIEFAQMSSELYIVGIGYHRATGQYIIAYGYLPVNGSSDSHPAEDYSNVYISIFDKFGKSVGTPLEIPDAEVRRPYMGWAPVEIVNYGEQILLYMPDPKLGVTADDFLFDPQSRTFEQISAEDAERFMEQSQKDIGLNQPFTLVVSDDGTKQLVMDLQGNLLEEISINYQLISWNEIESDGFEALFVWDAQQEK